MPHISATRLRLRKLWYLPAFLAANQHINAQARAAAGFLGGKILVDRRLTFWTCTLWESDAAMKAFRDTGAHREAMPKLALWCDEAMVAQWQGEVIPSWADVHARILQGRPSRVKYPNSRHELRVIPPPRPLVREGVLTPLARAP